MKLTHTIAVAWLRAVLKVETIIWPKIAVLHAFRLFCTPFPRSEKTVSAVFDKAEKLHLTIDGLDLVGYRWNHPQPKKLLVLHGFRSSAKNFEHYIMPMIGKGYEVMAFDAPAHGESQGRRTNVRQYMNLIEEVYTRYGPIDAFIAHSFGGLAVSLALENIPHNRNTRVALIAPATETTTAIDLLFRFLRLQPALREPFENMVLKVEGRPAEWYSIKRTMEHLSASILWIQDELDDITPFSDVQPIMEAKYANVTFLITKGWGHRRIYHEQKVVQAVEKFL